MALYATAIFAAAFLMFLVQPMVGKRILPWFGGVPAVWTICLAFYQTTLFLGYAYAHLMIRFANPALQLAIHATAAVFAWTTLPVLPESPPDLQGSTDPIEAVLRLLSSNVALPFLVLASTGPLVQAWFARAHPTSSPYALYAVSNVGSFLALFAYPFVLEPRMSLSQTGSLWTVAFAATALLVLACALPTLKRTSDDSLQPAREEHARGDRIGVVTGLLWILLSAAAVILLMSITNKLCLDVASVPFLWIVPLAIYLATFIVAFSSERSYRRAPFVACALVAFVATHAIGKNPLIVWQVVTFGALLFCACTVLHGELYKARPAPHALTTYYLCVSAGGAIGGLLVGVGAPVVFDDYYELPVALGLGALLVLVVCARDPQSFLRRSGPRWRQVAVGSLVLAVAGRFAWQETQSEANQIHRERSFFGVLKVEELSDGMHQQRSLTNGTTVHGVQFQDKSARRLPTSYFGRATGLGLMAASRPDQEESRIGVIGLGVGTLAAYGRRGDTMRFYEIDPVVMRISGPGGYFSFVEDSAARVELVLGDARLSLEDEQRRGVEQAFDVLVLDAFTSDAIPIHLMTREAFEVYFKALAPGGLMAAHVSNRHFRLTGLVSRMAAEFGASSLEIRNSPAPHLQSGLTDWVIITRDSDQLKQLRIRIEKRRRELELPPDSIRMRWGSDADRSSAPLWTDDYSDLVSVIRWD